MELLLNEQQSQLHDAAARLGASKCGPRRARALRDAKTDIDAPAFDDMVKAGWLSALVSEANDGLGLGAFDLALALEQNGRQVAMVPLVEAASAVWALSEATNLSSTIREAMESKLVVPAARPAAQGYAGSNETSGVRFDANSSTLSGALSFVPFAGVTDLFLVAADDGAASALCLVPRDVPGLSIATTRNIDGSTSSRLTFDRVIVTKDHVVAQGEPAATIISRMQDLLLLGTSAELLGVAQAAHDITLDYIKLREQFGKPVGSFQALQHRAVDGFVDIELNRSLLFSVLTAFDAGTHHPAMISAVKARVGRGALNMVRAALQLHGAIGYTDEHDIGIYYKRAVTLAAKYGNEITHVGRFSDLTLPTQDAAE